MYDYENIHSTLYAVSATRASTIRKKRETRGWVRHQRLGAAANFDDCASHQIWELNVKNNIYILIYEYSSTWLE